MFRFIRKQTCLLWGGGSHEIVTKVNMIIVKHNYNCILLLKTGVRNEAWQLVWKGNALNVPRLLTTDLIWRVDVFI